MNQTNKEILDQLLIALSDARPRALFIFDGELKAVIKDSKRFEKMFKDFSSRCIGVYNSKATRSMIVDDYLDAVKWEGLK